MPRASFDCRHTLNLRPEHIAHNVARRRAGRWLVLLLAIAWCLIIGGVSARAQNVQFNSKSVDMGMRGGAKVNPSTHALEIEIPLGNYPGRAGMNLPVTLNYSSKVWRVAFSAYIPQTQFQQGYTGATARWSEHSSAGWTSTLRMPYIDNMYGTEYYSHTGGPAGVGGCTSPNCFTIDRLLIRMPDGSAHEMRSTDEPLNCNYPNPCTAPGDMYAVDGSRLRYHKATQTLFMPDGARYLLGSGQYIDRNGNVMTSGSGGWTDTLGRTIPTPPLSTSPGDYTYTLTGVGGNGANYVFKWRHLSDVLTTSAPLRYVADWSAPGQTTAYSPTLFTAITGDSTYIFNAPWLFNPVVLHQIVMPTGQAYTFTYNVYGEIDKVVFPNGGYEKYDHAQKFPISNTTPFYSQGNRGVTARRISARGDGTDEIPWTYTQGGSPDCVPGGMCTTGPDGVLTVTYVHGEATGPFGYSYFGARAGRSFEERIYAPPDGAGNRQMLRRKLTEWSYTGTNAVSTWAQQATRNARVTKEVEILLDTGGDALARTTTYGYDTTFQFSVGPEQTLQSEYDFVAVDQTTAQSGTINSFPLGTLLRTTETSYLTGNASYRARNLLGLATGVTIRDGAGTIAAQTTTSYDEAAYPLVSYGAITGWSDPGTGVRGNATTVSRWLDTSGTYLHTHSQYDQAGNPVNAWDANNNLTQTAYSAAYAYAYPTSVTTNAPDPNNTGYGSAQGFVASTAYDFHTGVITSTTDANNKTVTYEYNDPSNRLTRVNQPDGGRTTHVYVDTHQCGAYVETSKLLDSSGREAKMWQFFDGLGRPYLSETKENQDPSNPYIRVDTRYDSLGKVSQVSRPYRTSGCTAAANPSGQWTVTAYEVLGRMKSVTTPDGAAVTTSYSGNVTTVTDQAGKKRRSINDALGRVVQVIEDPTGGGLNYLTTYTYDVLGNLRKVDQGGQSRFFRYDSLSRLVRAKHPEQAVNSSLNSLDPVTGNNQWSLGYSYDANGNLNTRTDARGVTASYGYDRLNRNTTTSYTGDSSGTPATHRKYDFGVNGKGRPYLTQQSGSITSATYSDQYDAVGRVIVQRQKFETGGVWSADYAVTRNYDLAGNVLTQTYPSGRTVTYNYDTAGRFGDNGAQPAFKGTLGDGTERTYVSQVLYDELGGVSQERYGTQTPVYNKSLYNVRGQLTEIRVATTPNDTFWNRGALINHYSNSSWAGSGPDNNGNLRKQNVYIPNDDAITGYSLTTFFYEYDALNRLTRVREGRNGSDQWSQNYQYDRWGNRTINQSATWNAPEPQFTVDAATNRLGVPAGQCGQMLYDAAGNLTLDTYQGGQCGGGTRIYDAENRMTSAQYLSGQTQTAAYVYDADGRRVRRNVGTTAEVWQVNGVGGELLAEYAAGASPTQPRKEYGYRSGELLVTASSGGAAPAPPVNVAAAAAGATATASTAYDAYGLTTARAINGSRTYAGSYWNDQTWGSFPDWLQIDFAGTKTINEVNVFFLQDNYATAEPTEGMTFTQMGITSFDVQYWTGSTWATVPGGNVTGNNKVWRKFTFAPLTTPRIRVVVNGASDVWSRIVEVEAYEGTTVPATTDVRWLVADQLGTPRMIIDKTGSLAAVSRHDYLPFGEELFAGVGGRTTAQGYSQTDNVRQHFTGYERDPETGLDFASARYYSSAQGRFTSPDPLLSSGKTANPQTWNRYAYCGNNPANNTDPTGLDWYYNSKENKYRWFENGPTEEGWERLVGDRFVYHSVNGWVALDPYSSKWQAGYASKEEAQGLVDKWWNAPPQNRALAGTLGGQWGPPVKQSMEYMFQWMSIFTTPVGGATRLTTLGLEGGGQAAARMGVFRFSQTSARHLFSEEGSFAGKTIGEVAKDLRAGTLSPANVPVGVVEGAEGVKLIVNTRSSLALMRAGIPQRSWNIIDLTANPAVRSNIEGRLIRNGLTNHGTDVLRITEKGSGFGKAASSLR